MPVQVVRFRGTVAASGRLYKESMMKRTFFAAATLLSLFSLPILAQEGPQRAPETPEVRQKMAKMHDEMAACLRSDKPISECHKEMMQSCRGMDGTECPMMGAKSYKRKGRVE